MAGQARTDGGLSAALLRDDEVAALFGAEAEIAAMVEVEVALAQAQGGLRMIPEAAAEAIAQAAPALRLDPADLDEATRQNGVPVPGLLAAMRAQLPAEAAAFLHWGATSQDIVDTALMLRLRRFLVLMQARLDRVLTRLAALAEAEAETPMAARSYGQIATPSSLGAQVAAWGWPLVRHDARLTALRGRLMAVSLGGAAGTLGAMGPRGPEVRAALARRLDLGDPGASWHAERDRLTELSSWCAGLAGALGKMGEDLILMTQSGVAEVQIAGAGGSSTMPQKQNPVAPSAMVALVRHAVALDGVMQGAALHRQARDGAAWFAEWLALPPLCEAAARALALAGDLSAGLQPDRVAMARAIAGMDGLGLIHAEALTFALARHMPRPEAQAAVKALCAEARESGRTLADLAAGRWGGLLPDPGWLDPARQMGEAPAAARRFAAAVASRRAAASASS